MYTNDITIQQLLYFFSIANTKNFSKAAEQLYIAQPALSKSIAKLENSLGVKLFERVYHGVELTDAGLYFYNNAQPLADELIKTFNNVQMNWGESDSRVTVCCFRKYQDLESLIDVITKFKKQNPGNIITLDTVFSDDVPPAISKDSYDAYISPYFYIKNNSTMNYKVIEETPAYINIASSHPLASKKNLQLSDLKNETFCLLSPEEKATSINTQVLARLSRYGISPKHIVYPKNIASRQVEVLSGYIEIGVPLVNPHIKNIPILPDDHEADVVVAWNKNKHSKLLQEFVELL